MANKLNVQGTEITLISDMGNDYICLTDMAGAKSDEVRAADVIKNWLRNRYTIEFLGTWEQIHNPNFNVVEFDHFRMHAGLPLSLVPQLVFLSSFILSRNSNASKRKSKRH